MPAGQSDLASLDLLSRACEGLEREYASTGLFTHSYMAFGGLSANAPLFKWVKGVDSSEIFDLSSLTKALVTTPLVFRMVQQRNLTLDTPLGEFLPKPWLTQCGALARRPLRTVLAHTSGLPSWRNFWLTREESGEGRWDPIRGRSIEDVRERERRVREVLARTELKDSQGFVYSDLGFIALGIALEYHHKSCLSDVTKDWMVNDLKINGADLGAMTMLPNREAQKSCVPTSYCRVRGYLLRGEVHDENAAALGGACGHAGAFSSGDGLLSYLRALVEHPIGQWVLKENSDALTKNSSRGLCGWWRGDGSAQGFGMGLALGHLGFTGTAFWLVPGFGSAHWYYSILLTNRVISGRVSPAINDYRRKFFEFAGRSVPRAND